MPLIKAVVSWALLVWLADENFKNLISKLVFLNLPLLKFFRIFSATRWQLYNTILGWVKILPLFISTIHKNSIQNDYRLWLLCTIYTCLLICLLKKKKENYEQMMAVITSHHYVHLYRIRLIKLNQSKIMNKWWPYTKPSLRSLEVYFTLLCSRYHVFFFQVFLGTQHCNLA